MNYWCTQHGWNHELLHSLDWKQLMKRVSTEWFHLLGSLEYKLTIKEEESRSEVGIKLPHDAECEDVGVLWVEKGLGKDYIKGKFDCGWVSWLDMMTCKIILCIWKYKSSLLSVILLI